MEKNKKLIMENKIRCHNFCYGCGACVGICPNNALSMKITGEIGYYRPNLQKEKCTDCGRCLQVCPWNNFDIDTVNREFLNKNNDDVAIGQYIDCYTGYSRDEEIRKSSSSGGVVTSILTYLFDRSMIDGAVVVKVSSLDTLQIEPFIARSKYDIISSKGSKYISVTFGNIFKDIRDFNGRLAFVGLPCHIQAIRKLELVDKKIKDKVKYHLGLMCSGTVGLKGTEILINSFKVPKESIKSISYRGDGWPSGFKLVANNKKGIENNKREIPYPLYLLIIRTYLQPSCLVCWDALNEFSDISFGDAWLRQIKDQDNIGTSLLIARTIEGNSIIEMAKKDNIIDISKIDTLEILESQKGNINFKKYILNIRLSIFKILFGHEPEFLNVKVYDGLNIKNVLKMNMLFIRTYLANNRYFNKIIDPFVIYILRKNIKS